MRLCRPMIMIVALGMSGVAFGSGDDWYHRERNGSASYQQGYEDGARRAERDLRHGRREHGDPEKRGDRNYHDGYRSGYENVYNGRGSDVYYGREPGYYGNGRDRNRDGGYYGNGPIGSYGQVGSYRNQAYQIGYQDGINEGRNDRQTGHSYRPTHDGNFKHADRGYNSSLGDKQMYKDTYRQGYQSGYQLGYQGACPT